jgi:hypothetical protein
MIMQHAQSRPPPREARLVLLCILLIAFLGHPRPEASGPAHPLEHYQPSSYQTRFFGGHPLHGSRPFDLGPNTAGMLTRLMAAPPTSAPSCIVAVPAATPDVSVPKDIAADLPGLYGAPWIASFNGNLIAVLHVTVPRNPAWQPAGPVLQIYRHGNSRPVFSQTVPVSVARGSKALLYRMFINGPIRCIDLVIPNGASTGTAYLYYPYRGRMFQAEGIFTVQR